MSKVFSVFIFSLLLLTVTLHSAEAAKNSNQNTNQKRELVQTLSVQRRNELQERIAERKASQAAKVNQVRKALIKNYFNRMKLRIEALINRLEILIGRIESRLDKIAANNEDINTAPIQSELDRSKTLLVDSKDLLTLAEQELDNTINSDNPRESFMTVRDTVGQIRDNLREVHRILVHTVGEIRGLRVGQNDLNGGGSNEDTTSPEPSEEVAPATQSAI